MSRRSDACSLALVLLALVWMISGWAMLKAQTDPIAAVKITDLEQRMDRAAKDGDDRFNRIESQNQYILTVLFLNLGAHGIQLGRSQLQRRKASPVHLTDGED